MGGSVVKPQTPPPQKAKTRNTYHHRNKPSNETPTILTSMRGEQLIEAERERASEREKKNRNRVKSSQTAAHQRVMDLCALACKEPDRWARLKGHNVSSLPNKLVQVAPLLRRIDLSHNSLRMVPAELFELECLENITLAHNKIADSPADSLPEGGAILIRCTTLDLSHNMLTCTPALASRMPSLTLLDLGGNPLAGLNARTQKDNKEREAYTPMYDGGAQNLKAFGLGYRTCLCAEGVLADVVGMTGLEDLRLPHSGLGDQDWMGGAALLVADRDPAGLSREALIGLEIQEDVHSTTKLFASGVDDGTRGDQARRDRERVCMGVLGQLFGLTGLTALDLSDNRIPSLPGVLWRLTNLTSLGLASNVLDHMPAAAVLSQLRVLDLSRNQIATWPEALVMLTRLESLDLSWNEIEVLPSYTVDDDGLIGSMLSLTSLNVASNNIKDIRPVLISTSITTLILKGNPIVVPAPEVVALGLEGMKQHEREKVVVWREEIRVKREEDERKAAIQREAENLRRIQAAMKDFREMMDEEMDEEEAPDD